MSTTTTTVAKDTLLVMPSVCTRQDIFGTSSSDDGESTQAVDPDSLAERVRRHPDVTNFVPVEGAAVPILTFDWEGVNIDLLFARLNTASVPPDFDIDNDASLDGVDTSTSRTMNATRVTNLIAVLVSGTRERYQTFLTVVRCVRKWAKARGLYSNKMGYWGGVNINIAVALCVQLYPNASPASLLRKFFLVFKTWYATSFVCVDECACGCVTLESSHPAIASELKRIIVACNF